LKNPSRQLSIVIYRTGGVGDVILSSVSLAYIFSFQRSANVYWVGYSPKLDLIAEAYPKVIPVSISSDVSYRENFKRITEKVKRADVFIDLQQSPRSVILCRAAAVTYGAKYYTWNKGSIRRTIMVVRSFLSGRHVFRHALMVSNKPRYSLMLDCVRRALEPLGYAMSDQTQIVPKIPTHNEPFLLRPLQSGVVQWIAVCAGGLYEGKWASADKFAGILNDVNQAALMDLGVVFVGDKNDYLPSEEVTENLIGQRAVVNLCGELTLMESAQVLSECSVMLANDTATAHLAEAAGLEVAMLFGSTVEAFGYAPFRKGSRAFSAEVGCRPCTKGGSTICRYKDKLCFSKIDNREVVSFLTQKLMSTHA